MDDTVNLFLWVGRGVSPEFLEAMLQIRTLDGVDCSRLRVFTLDSDVSTRVNRLINAVRSLAVGLASRVLHHTLCSVSVHLVAKCRCDTNGLMFSRLCGLSQAKMLLKAVSSACSQKTARRHQ